MLLQLNIKNFALIEELSISFDKGFNVLTGETGAGKSILIDAISYVLGGKFNRDLIRTGENKTYVEAIFSIENESTERILKDQGIDFEDILIIGRETFQYGKSIAKVNAKSVLLANLKEITSTLLDIHGQHENQNLLSCENHINYLDYFSEKELYSIMEKYKSEYLNLLNIENKIKELSGGDESEREKLMDFLKYQIKEIGESNLKEGEEEELDNKFLELSNAEKISKVLNNSYGILYGGLEEESSAFDSLGYVIREMESINSIDKITSICQSLKDAYYIIEESIRNIGDIKDNIYYDENELDRINSRLFQISTLKKKYGTTIKEIIEYKDKIEKQYEDMINSEEIIEKLNNDRKKVLNNLKEIAMQMHNVRVKYAEELEVRVKEELSYVGLSKTRFKINVDLVSSFFKSGCDKVEFYVSTNPGEPLKPLDKVVSGGELSRIMLALKTVFVDKDKIPSVIFDEIDTGISGVVAQSVGEKMYSISHGRQVFCITHLSQIACMSDNHYYIHKEVLQDKTYTKVTKLSKEDKEIEIGKMIGGSNLTDITLQNAKEIIKIADNKKEKILKNS
ncbi:DNA repair protein RecN [Clostridium botulinum]|uniref:DNA repair protein RecN n=1 Tax=Clostridium botulinum (strain Hall / ATCC 3502 / NCTC 13319 / Type A) TaxID=441771 RepID=A5I301_CLOBH|nr:DNA repair protein RecN [Clostridium botulinum]ABS34497.1 DNA repair protein RecN [Clostridium botulinum A str. ATCC 19397]ABS39260.1 DNA repair protein RecN [Clostridium botulinum A str. Hall]AWB17750.1 DNA repair protein RecN [Clostridium botulinum]AWB30536.1 DNA repair protein RecN [Clostridium botulinum]EGT5614610.1 DNA repair protein RecN [Clostridium botulinum]